MDVIPARRLQLGDVGGHIRRALKRFPVPGVAQRILDRYFVPGGKPKDKPFRAKPVPNEKPSRHRVAEQVWLSAEELPILWERGNHRGIPREGLRA